MAAKKSATASKAPAPAKAKSKGLSVDDRIAALQTVVTAHQTRLDDMQWAVARHEEAVDKLRGLLREMRGSLPNRARRAADRLLAGKVAGE